MVFIRQCIFFVLELKKNNSKMHKKTLGSLPFSVRIGIPIPHIIFKAYNIPDIPHKSIHSPANHFLVIVLIVYIIFIFNYLLVVGNGFI